MKWHLNDDTAVSDNYVWQPIDTCPIGVKCLLLGGGGVIIVGNIYQGHKWYTHWAPLPKPLEIDEDWLKKHQYIMSIYEQMKDD